MSTRSMWRKVAIGIHYNVNAATPLETCDLSLSCIVSLLPTPSSKPVCKTSRAKISNIVWYLLMFTYNIFYATTSDNTMEKLPLLILTSQVCKMHILIYYLYIFLLF